MTLDPITLSVIQSGLQQVCDEMDLSFSRAAFSPVIAEANDRSDGIYSAEDGALIAQGAGGLPVFVGTMQFSTRTLIKMIADGRVLPPEPDDIYIVNDPYLGGTHLMDVRFARPYWRDGEIFCWLSNTGHWPDTGGAVPGGFSASATAVEQEGLRLPPVKLFKKGKMDQEIYSIICSNIRVSGQRIGDVKAQASALLVGEDRLTEILDRYGDDVVREAIAELRRRAAKQMRANISQIPDGVYTSTAIVDSDGVVDEPLEINLSITKSGDELDFDFSKSSPPCQGPMNSVLATTLSSVYLAMRHIFQTCRSAPAHSSPLRCVLPKIHSSTPTIPARSPGVRRKSANASRRRCLPLWSIPCRIWSRRHRPARAAISHSAAMTPQRAGTSSCINCPVVGMVATATMMACRTAVLQSEFPRRRRWRSWSRPFLFSIPNMPCTRDREAPENIAVGLVLHTS